MSAPSTPCAGLHEIFQPCGEVMAISQRPPRQSVPTLEAWARAVELCAGCHRREQCLADELDAMRRGFRTLGVHGGTTPPERMAMVSVARHRPPRVASKLSGRSAGDLRPIRHGTHSGYVTHLARGERACDECRSAHSAYRAARARARREGARTA